MKCFGKSTVITIWDNGLSNTNQKRKGVRQMKNIRISSNYPCLVSRIGAMKIC